MVNSEQVSAKPLPERNYTIDALKLLLAFGVFFSHTGYFVGKNTRFLTYSLVVSFGTWCVFAFAMISGMLMIDSYQRHKSQATGTPAEQAFNFTIRKIKSFVVPYLVAFAMSLAIYIYIYQR